VRIALPVIVALLVIIILIYTHFGGFAKINIRIEKQGGETLVYENMTGAYSQATKVTMKVYDDLLNNDKIETTKGFGIYYDNPKNVEQSKLRSEIGCIVEDIDNNRVEQLKQRYQVKILPDSECIVAEFPFKGGISIMLGLLKVYPALNKYIQAYHYTDGPIMEIYDVPNKVIVYRKEIIQ
jgi:hypothetical protein